MARRSAERHGKAWVELVLVVAVVALGMQLMPSVQQQVVGILDVRSWSRDTWMFANVAVLVILLLGQFGPGLADRWRRRVGHEQEFDKQPSISRAEQREDIRIVMQRDEALRAKSRKKFALYGILGPAAIVAIASAISWIRSGTEIAERASNMLLPDIEGDDWHGTEEGVVGIKFRVRPDRDVRVAQIGVYDANRDGLQVDRRAGIYEVSGDKQNKNAPVAEVLVPYGGNAPLQDSFRWVPLDKPVTLNAGKDYILAVEALGYVNDDWPAMFKESALQVSGVKQVWNPVIVGEKSSVVTETLVTERGWPAVPDQPVPTKGGIAHGFANLIVDLSK